MTKVTGFQVPTGYTEQEKANANASEKHTIPTGRVAYRWSSGWPRAACHDKDVQRLDRNYTVRKKAGLEVGKAVGLAAVSAGIIAGEDETCEKASVQAIHEASDGMITREYDKGVLGSRYAACSVWRPLSTPTRDALPIAPRCSINQDSGPVF